MAFNTQAKSALLYYIFGVPTFAANLVVIVAISRHHSLHSEVNMYIISLAASDTMLGFLKIVAGTFELPGLQNKLGSNEAACLIYLSLAYVGYIATILNSTLIALDRYVCITRPSVYRTLVTKQRIAFALGVTWALAISYSSWPLVSNNFQKYEPCDVLVIIPTEMRVHASSLVYLICTISTALMYLRISIIASYQQARIHQVMTRVKGRTTRSRTRIRSSLRVLRSYKLFLCVFGLQFVFFTPYFVAEYTLDSLGMTDYELLNSCLFLIVLNSGMNVFVYWYFNRHIRRAITNTVRCRKPSYLEQSETTESGAVYRGSFEISGVTPSCRAPPLPSASNFPSHGSILRSSGVVRNQPKKSVTFDLDN